MSKGIIEILCEGLVKNWFHVDEIMIQAVMLENI